VNEAICELIESCDKELEDIKGRIEESSSFDKVVFYLTQYALMKASGTVEYAVRSIVADYCDLSASSQVHNYIDATVRNASISGKYQNMSSLLKKFDSEWARLFKAKVAELAGSQKVIQSADSLVNNRHSFAHGGNSSASFSDIVQYYNDAKKLVVLLDEVVNG
jgi:hypothetical protein